PCALCRFQKPHCHEKRCCLSGKKCISNHFPKSPIFLQCSAPVSGFCPIPASRYKVVCLPRYLPDFGQKPDLKMTRLRAGCSGKRFYLFLFGFHFYRKQKTVKKQRK